MLDLSNVWPEWKAVEKLGEGSFGRVYKCIKNEFGIESECAIKVISIPQSQEELINMSFEGVTSESAKTYYSDVVNDFANEIKLMEMLKGAPNVVHVENFRIIERKDEIGWDIYIRMELLQSFVNYSLNKKFTEDEVKKFALDINNALEVCSKNGVIHRDIKPANIFVDKFGSFKLGDFGVARRLEGTMSVMSKKGTYSYMAPEVFRGEKYDCRADIYSLGMIMYKLLNRNRDPFVAMDKPVVGFKERNEAIERRRNGEKLPAPVDASPAMAAIILKACEFRAEDRYASVEEFRAALNSLNAPAYVDEPTVAARDFEEQTVAEGVGLYSSQKEKAATDDATVKADPEEATLAARDVDLTVGAPVQANYDEATVVMDDEPTAIDDSEATALADDEATVIADDEPTAIDDGETTVLAGDEPTVVDDNEATVMDEKEEEKSKSHTYIFVVVTLLLVIIGIALWAVKQGEKPYEAKIDTSESSSEYYGEIAYIEEILSADDNLVTDLVTEVVTEIVTNAEGNTEVVTEIQTEVVTEVMTEVITEIVMELETEVVTEMLTEVVYEYVTEEPWWQEGYTEIYTEWVTEAPYEYTTRVETVTMDEKASGLLDALFSAADKTLPF